MAFSETMAQGICPRRRTVTSHSARRAWVVGKRVPGVDRERSAWEDVLFGGVPEWTC